jgi:hypothetical protein
MRTKYIIVKDGEVLGWCNGLDTAQKVCFLRKAAYLCIYQHLLQLDDDWFYKLYEDYYGPLPEPPLMIEEMAQHLWEALDAKKFPALRKPSAMDLIREMFIIRDRWRKEDIQAMCIGAEWDYLRGVLSRLRAEGMYIKHQPDGNYVRK